MDMRKAENDGIPIVDFKSYHSCHSRQTGAFADSSVHNSAHSSVGEAYAPSSKRVGRDAGCQAPPAPANKCAKSSNKIA
jgi:hypothetical protein